VLRFVMVCHLCSTRHCSSFTF